MKFKNILKAILITGAAVLILLYPSAAAASTVRSINVCIDSVIPSMFAFMVISTYIQSSGLYKVIFRPLMPVMKRLVKADESMISVFLLSLIGGYPVGVKLLKETIAENKNYHEIADVSANASAFCYCISPAFAVIMLGNGIFGSTSAGIIIYLSDMLACLTMAIIVSRRTQLTSHTFTAGNGKGLTDAVNSATHALGVICPIIIAFDIMIDCITSALSDAGITATPWAAGVLEISNLLKLSSVSYYSLPLTAAVSSIGGVCVLIQCLAIVKQAFPVRKFLLARLPCMLLSGLYSLIFMQFIDVSVPTAAVSSTYTYSFSANKIIVPILLAMCIIIFYRSDNFSEKV